MADSDGRTQRDASSERASESRSGVREAGIESLLEAALSGHAVDAQIIATLLERALDRGALTSLPRDPARVRSFVTGALSTEIEARFGPDAAREVSAAADALARVLEARDDAASSSAAPSEARSHGTPSEVPAVIYVLADRPAIAARVRMLLGARAEVIRARSLEDVLRASVLRTGWRSAVLIDLRPGCVLDTPAAETLTRVLGRMPAIVWGDDAIADELRWRAARSKRITACGPGTRPEDVAMLLELQLSRP